MSYAQCGEDELIDAALARIGGPINHWCFEVGAADGRHLSNTLHLREQGWTAVLAEPRPEAFERLQRDYGQEAFCVHELVTDLDHLLERAGAPENIDFGSIDIDGQDYWLWHDMEKYRPRVVCIEYNPHENRANFPGEKPCDRRGSGQSGLIPIVQLGYRKGYELVGKTYCNLLFVDKNEQLNNN